MSGGDSRFVELKDKASRWIINRLISLANRDLDVSELQNRYQATQNRVGEVRLEDIERSWYFRVNDGSLELLDEPGKPDGGFRTTSDTIISLAKGERRVMDPATGDYRKEEYTPVDAMMRGHVVLWGDAVTQDALLFAQVLYKDVYPQIQEELEAAATEVGS